MISTYRIVMGVMLGAGLRGVLGRSPLSRAEPQLGAVVDLRRRPDGPETSRCNCHTAAACAATACLHSAAPAPTASLEQNNPAVMRSSGRSNHRVGHPSLTQSIINTALSKGSYYPDKWCHCPNASNANNEASYFIMKSLS